MATTSKVFARGSVPPLTGTFYIVPAGTTAIITNIAVVNTSTSAQTVTVYLDNVEIVANASIAANTTAFFDLKQVMNAGYKLEASASSSSVKLHVSGVEVA